jgi:hypothetical protein
MFDKRLYQVYADMLQRCYNPKCSRFASYGGRGILVCDRWKLSYRAFVEDMDLQPPGTTLERRNNDEGYSPENCYWAPWKKQFRNRRTNHQITIGDRTQILDDWAREKGISKVTLSSRLLRGWNPTDAVQRPVKKRKETNNVKKDISH